MRRIPPSGSPGLLRGVCPAALSLPHPSPLTSAALTSQKQAWRGLGRSPLGCFHLVEVPWVADVVLGELLGRPSAGTCPASLYALGPPPTGPRAPLPPVQFSPVAQSCLTLCDPMDRRPPCPSPAPGVCWLMPIKSVMPLPWPPLFDVPPLCWVSPPLCAELSMKLSLKVAPCWPCSRGLLWSVGNKSLCGHWRWESNSPSSLFNLRTGRQLTRRLAFSVTRPESDPSVCPFRPRGRRARSSGGFLEAFPAWLEGEGLCTPVFLHGQRCRWTQSTRHTFQ